VTTTPPIGAFHEALDAERFFEAHEILEAYWVGYRGDDRDFYKGLIQAAVALHHASEGNTAGARAVARRARGYLAPFAPRHGGCDVDAMLERLSRVAA
jgi:predicted metal-dependent hydrolase